MDAPSYIFFPENYNELFTIWNRFPSAVIYAGGTNIIRKPELPCVYICPDKIPEMHRITRTEYYLEIGAMAKLNQIILLGKVFPGALRKCLEEIGSVQIRNIATIGGNICSQNSYNCASAPLVALEAQYELRNAAGSRWIAAARYHCEYTVPEKPEILSRIRLPLHHWDYSVYKKFLSEDKNLSKALVYLTKTQKNTLSDIRVVYKNRDVLRNKEAESLLIGKKLPLTQKNANDFVTNWREFLAENKKIDELSKYELINCLETNTFNLSE